MQGPWVKNAVTEEHMKTFKTGLIALTVIMGTYEATAADDPLMQQAQKLFKPIPEAPPAVKGVPATPAMIKLFMEKGCAGCHNGINIGGASYAPFGVVEKPGADILPPVDKGRFQVTKTASDEYASKCRPAQHRTDTALFSFGQLLGSQASGRCDGNESTGTAPERSGDRQCCRIPPRLDRRAATGDLSHPPAEHQRYAAASTVNGVSTAARAGSPRPRREQTHRWISRSLGKTNRLFSRLAS